MTPKQKVLRRYPKAWALRPGCFVSTCWWVFQDENRSFAIGSGMTAREAWADAAKPKTGGL